MQFFKYCKCKLPELQLNGTFSGIFDIWFKSCGSGFYEFRLQMLELYLVKLFYVWLI